MKIKNIFEIVAGANSLLTRIGRSLQSPLLLAVRLYWGWQFAQTGWGKLHNLDKITEFFASLHIPAPHANAIFVANLEFFGGILLAFGLGSRFISLLLTGNMLVAYLTADREALLAIISEPSKFYGADPYTFLFASLLVLIFGAGIFSLDELLARLLRKQSDPKMGKSLDSDQSHDFVHSAFS